MRHFAFILLILFIQVQVFAQPKILKGRIVDADTQKGVAYTNIGIEGTFYGTASNVEGFFELKVPDNLINEKLYISAVGYVNQAFPISDLLKKDFVRIPLAEQTYKIEGVDVAAQSRVLFRIIRTASQKVPDNYYSGPVGLQFYYQEERHVNDSIRQGREAIIELYDKTGYNNPSITDAFQNRGYRFTQVKKNFDSWSFPSGQTGFDELIEMDMARLSNTIFKEELLNDYDLHLEGTRIYEGDSVWVISYKTAKAGLAHSGDLYGTKMNGKMYIMYGNYALIRNECVIESAQNNSMNRSLAANGKGQQNVHYHFVSSYRKHSDKYMLNYLECDKTYTNPEGEKVTYIRKANVLDLNNSPKAITGRNYFEDTPYVETFWKNFRTSRDE